MACRRLVILDPSFATRTGHNYSINSLLAEEAMNLGLGALVFAHQSMAPQADIVPAFRASAFDYYPANDVDALRVTYLCANAFWEDLVRDVEPRLAADDMLFMHTTNGPLLHGLLAWLRSAGTLSPAGLVVGLNIPPDFRQPNASISAFNAQHFSHVLAGLAETTASPRYYAETRELATSFERLGARSIVRRRFPVRVAEANSSPGRHPGNEVLTFLVPGEIRAEKGHAFLINTLIELAQANAELLRRVRFRFFAVAMPEHVERFLRANPQLFDIPADREIDNRRYWEILREADFVVCAYDPKEYRERSSGIFVEALAAGIPVVVSEGTSLAAELADEGKGAGVVVEYGNALSLAHGLQRAVTEATALRDRARQISGRYREESSPAGFLRWLVGSPHAVRAE